MYLFEHTAEWLFRDNTAHPEFYEKLKIESVDGVDYIYIIENNEAYILNVHFATENRGIKNRTLVLPDVLGGCNVVALSYPNNIFSIFWYISYGETLEDFGYHYPYIRDDYPDYDPEIFEYGFVNKLVLPKGCKYIYEDALEGYGGSFEFSKSLRFIENYEYIGEYISGVDSFLGENTFITPDCEFGTNFFNDIQLRCDNYICQSRFPGYTFDTSYSIPKAICVPYNVTAEQSEYALFKSKVSNKLWGNTVIYCSEDSPTYAVIQANKELGEYQVVTDIPKAEYIEFPEETVNVCVGDVVDLEAKTYPAEAVWTACDYTVSDPSIVQIDDYSGRITALKEGTVTVTATHCERGFVDTCTVKVTTEPEPVSGVKEIKPATDAPYFAYGNRDYKL
ncbi:MAG: Ig domain-containing protein, partial [Clostridia bacterium]|nr:Ig domain-containing protein [Clostridia bacterium]